MRLITNIKKERLKHMLKAAELINLDVVVGEPFEKEGRPLKNRENVCGIYAKGEACTDAIIGKYYVAVQLLGEHELHKWRKKGYKLQRANGLQFYLDMPEEEVRKIENKFLT